MTRSLYGWGTVFALGHYIFGPWVCALSIRYAAILGSVGVGVWVM
jgi:hypothetical protein